VLAAPAKVNLGLRVRGRRDDGLHLLESLFVPTELGDEVELEIAPSATPAVSIDVRWEGELGGVPTGDDNLALRAARAFLASSDLRLAVRIQLFKRIPVAAGLGGGSSDAGAVLRGLGELLPDGVRDLPGVALGLGADVPYFLDPRPALVCGIGERIRPVPGMPRLWMLLVNPGLPLSTGEVYRAYDADLPALTPDSWGSTMRWPCSGEGRPVPLGDLTPLLENDLERAAVRLLPAIVTLRERLDAVGATAVGMSGSGPTLFGIFETETAMRNAEGRLGLVPPARCWRTRTLGSG
jgi:4-diphosphocytidyl-2-C-methyl-D-erythritol kinase